MIRRIAIVISPNWKDYAEKYLAECLESIRSQDFEGESKIFLVDNETNEKSFLYLKKIAPEAEIVRNETNDGFAKGNNEAIKIALRADFDYIVLFNMDTVVEASCLTELVKTVESDEKIGAVQARLMMWPEKTRVNSLGNATHFLGFGYCQNYKEIYTEVTELVDNKSFNVGYPSGAAVLFRAEVLKKVGLFDEEFWMYNEDQDLGWRIWLSGFRCVLAPGAVTYHKYEFAKSIKQYYFMDRNRIIAIIKNYHILTLVFVLPAFLVMEIGLLFFASNQGWLKEKIKVWQYFFNRKNWVYILRERKKSQTLRQVRDRDIVGMITGRIWYQEVGDWKLKVINPIFSLYWWMVRKIIVW